MKVNNFNAKEYIYINLFCYTPILDSIFLIKFWWENILIMKINVGKFGP